ncbi:hypothetical protein [Flavobacterium geliluteum]|uniref:Lipoprotein n=1 Tax=Flavobacterium geliluteum TaxID=2816120 RepID=A0A941AZM9_9FLAO|nr:hypothetical protein [Flavobacterium geliluteum]MBP4139167.1 hypothetical protein [Flavobacterium geliluteum]
MKTTITKFLILTLLSLVFISCSSAKKYKAENTTLKSEIQKRDSLKTVIINQAIDDKLITPVVQSNTGNRELDSLVNAKVDEILSKLNTSKDSGDNSYKLIYDKLAKQLEFYSKMAQTKNENSTTKTSNDKTIIQIKKIPVVTEKPLSKLEKFLIGLGILTLLFLGYKTVVFIKNKTSLC